jgi:(1->4)-alpha-D-glucan 1-alpha-D-glucosylmutase
LIRFARALLTAPGNERFLADFLPFQRKIAWFGMLNSLAQTLLKLAAPGVPDIYQGCELWNLTLVDPDNRRPVDFAPRREALAAMQAATAGGGLTALATDLAAHPGDGRLKQFLIWRALGLRRERATLFRDGAYVPLAATGEHAAHVCAFARVLGDECVVAVASRLVCSLLDGETKLPVGAAVWGDTAIDLAPLRSRAWDDTLTAVAIGAAGPSLPLAIILARLPASLLAAR